MITITKAHPLYPGLVVGRSYEADTSLAQLMVSGGFATLDSSKDTQALMEPSASSVVVLGDSLVDNGSNAINGKRNSRNIFEHVNRRLGRPFTIRAEVGFSGMRIDQVLARWSDAVSPNNPGIVAFIGGANDYSNNDSAATMFSRLRAGHRRAVDEGRRFVYMGMSPIPSPEVAQFLDMVRQLARDDSTFEYTGGAEYLLNYNGTPAEVSAPTPLTGALLVDGVHPTAYGANLWANGPVNYFTRQGFQPSPFFSNVSANGSSGDYKSNAITNGLVGAAGAGWLNQVVPGGTRTPTQSVQAMGSTGLQAGLPGRLYRVVWAPGAGPASADRMQTVAVNDANGTADQYAGRTFVARCYAKVSATGGNILGAELTAVVYNWSYGVTLATAVDNALFDSNSMDVWSLKTTSYEGYFETEPFTLPASWDTPTQAHFLNYFTAYGDPGATVTVDVGCMEIAEVFALPR